MAGFRPGRLDALRAEIAALETGGRGDCESLSWGEAALDVCFPAGGLPLGNWHEFAGAGLEIETAAAPAAFAALIAAPLARRGEAIWVLQRDDLHAPGLSTLGFPGERLIQVCARDAAETLAVLEDALSTAGVACAFAEVEAVDLVAGRRLQLACERRGATAFIIRRRPYGGAPRARVNGSPASRWRIAPAPSAPAPDIPGLGPPRWRVELERVRGGRPGAWIMEAREGWEPTDAAHPLRLVAHLGDRQLETPPPERAVA